jgi:TM2 domain-containing membrane protein YozV
MNCANHPDRERVAFCQNCGKPLCQECTRTVGSAVFCEPCLIARLAGTGNPDAAGGPIPGATYPDGTIPGSIPPPPPPPDEPNPGLAALLGFIPGVGAMYNGQYAKGIVHLIVFAVLVSLASENGIFGLFIAGWVFYQIIEAYHTAQARRDGTPLPNPFGLNDLGERLGFGKSWPGGAQSHPNGQGAATGTPVPPATSYPSPGYVPPAQGQPYAPPPASNWGSSWENYVPPVPPAASFTSSPPPPADFNPPPHAGDRFPSGAIWLIALGAIFLIGNSGMFHGAFAHLFVPMILIGFGVWQFVRKMTDTGPLADDGTAAYKFRLFHALRGSIWIMLIGVLFLLDSSHILRWSRSWPLFIIVAGVMAVLQRAVFSSAAAEPYPYPYPAPPPPAGPAPTASTSVVPPAPSNMHDEEGK